MIQERPIFRPKTARPMRDEQWEMKQAVIVRDGITTCFWCREPFASVEDATLEHIHPLSVGGVHDLRNCTLACYACNQRNQPRVLIETIEEVRARKEKEAQSNRLANGYVPLADCDPELVARFPAILRSINKPMKHKDASLYLKYIHKQLGRPPPTMSEKHVFKNSFNRWFTINYFSKNNP